ncbi:hypothetical protein N9Z09_03030 [Akkermansiaceae bacterium]|nr:hypothetical protein [Akkermansiaceae bacterium]
MPLLFGDAKPDEGTDVCGEGDAHRFAIVIDGRDRDVSFAGGELSGNGIEWAREEGAGDPGSVDQALVAEGESRLRFFKGEAGD